MKRYLIRWRNKKIDKGPDFERIVMADSAKEALDQPEFNFLNDEEFHHITVWKMVLYTTPGS